MPITVRYANGTATIEPSPIQHGLSWLALDTTDGDTPTWTPHQMRLLARALDQAATAHEADEAG